MSGFKRVLKKKGITQRQLAKEVGMSYQMICMYATGKVDMVVALINAIYLLQQEQLSGSDFTIQII